MTVERGVDGIGDGLDEIVLLELARIVLGLVGMGLTAELAKPLPGLSLPISRRS